MVGKHLVVVFIVSLFLWQLATTEENDVFFFSVCLFVSARVFRFSLSSPSHCCARDRQEGEISVACFPAVFFSFFVPFLFRGLERGTSVSIHHHQFLSFSSISVQVVESRMFSFFFSFLFFWLILSLDGFSFVVFPGVFFRVQSI